MPTPRARRSALVVILVLLVAAWVIARPDGSMGSNRYLPFYGMQANSFLHGHTHLDIGDDWGHDVIPHDGKKYLVFGPLNAVLFLPLVAALGQDVSERWFCLVVYAAYLALIAVFVHRTTRSLSQFAAWIAFFGLGTGLLTCAAFGTAWFSSVLVCSFLIAWGGFLIMDSGRSKPSRQFWRYVAAVGLACLAALDRFESILVAGVFAAAAVRHFHLSPRTSLRRLAWLALPFAGFAAAFCLWNWARFGEPFNLHYRDHGYATFFAPTIDKYGFSSLRYVVQHLYHGLFAVPKATLEFPFFEIDREGNGLFAVSPLFLFLVFRKPAYRPADWAALAGAVIITPVVFTHFSTGWSQFGYRYAVEVLPFLGYLLMRAQFSITSPLSLLLVAVSIWYNVFGTIAGVQ